MPSKDTSLKSHCYYFHVHSIVSSLFVQRFKNPSFYSYTKYSDNCIVGFVQFKRFKPRPSPTWGSKFDTFKDYVPTTVQDYLDNPPYWVSSPLLVSYGTLIPPAVVPPPRPPRTKPKRKYRKRNNKLTQCAAAIPVDPSAPRRRRRTPEFLSAPPPDTLTDSIPIKSMMHIINNEEPFECSWPPTRACRGDCEASLARLKALG